MSLIMLAGGCSTMPQYKFKPDEKHTTIKSLGFGWISICVDQAFFMPPKSGQPEEYLIPTNKRITVKKHVTFTGYNSTRSCSASISFVPSQDKTYIANANIGSEGCLIDLVQVDETKEVGVSFEPSIKPGECH